MILAKPHHVAVWGVFVDTDVGELLLPEDIGPFRRAPVLVICQHAIQGDDYRCGHFVLHSFGQIVVSAMIVSASDCWPRIHRSKTRNSGTVRMDKSNASGSRASEAERSTDLSLRSCVCVAKSGLQVGQAFFDIDGFVQLNMVCDNAGNGLRFVRG